MSATLSSPPLTKPTRSSSSRAISIHALLILYLQTLLLGGILGVGIYLAIRVKHLEHRLFVDEHSYVEVHAHWPGSGSSPFEVTAYQPFEVVGTSNGRAVTVTNSKVCGGGNLPCVTF